MMAKSDLTTEAFLLLCGAVMERANELQNSRLAA
jgi:hypothetical protein